MASIDHIPFLYSMEIFIVNLIKLMIEVLLLIMKIDFPQVGSINFELYYTHELVRPESL